MLGTEEQGILRYWSAPALEAYNKAIQCDPHYAYAYYQKGKALKHLEKLQEAQEAFDKAKELGYRR
ncbi:MAG: tetratricopeptide repeat protein [Chloroflexi bacterium]|nr:MAG: tetratricopeptide repeat protein [Chloroflexota bacterium]